MKKISLVIALTILILPLFVLGAAPITPNSVDLPTARELGVPDSPIKSVSQGVDVLAAVVGWVYRIFFIIAVLFILLAAYKYLTKSGEPEKIKEVHKQLIYAAIAIVVALLAVGFQTIVKNFLENPSAGSIPASQELPDTGWTPDQYNR